MTSPTHPARLTAHTTAEHAAHTAYGRAWEIVFGIGAALAFALSALVKLGVIR